MQESPKTIDGFDIRRSLATLGRHKWMIILATAVVVSTSSFFSYRKAPVYSSSARVLVRAIVPANAGSFFFPEINVLTERGLAGSEAVAEVVRKNTHSTASADSLLGGLSVAVEPDTDIMDFAYSSTDPKQSQQMANAFANGYLDYRRQQALQDFNSQTQNFRDQIDVLHTEIMKLEHQAARIKNPNRVSAIEASIASKSQQLGSLQQQLSDAGDPSAIERGGGEVLQAAVLPTAPISPNHKQDIALALVIGLALGAGAAALRDQFDTRLKGRHGLEEALKAPVLGTIPRVAGWRKRSNSELVTRDAPKSAASEAYRALRANLQFLAREDGVQVIAVSSPHLGDGKTTTVANIAVSLAQAGKRVIAISCDLRKPRLHQFFGVDNSVGVTSILTNGLGVAEATRRPDDVSPRVRDNLRIVASGPIPPDPAELLNSEEMQGLVEMLKESADFVIIDTPPLMAVADALTIGPRSDGMLIVVDSSSTSTADVEVVREQLQQVGCRILGSVLNSFDASGRGGSEYRYRYTYEYTDTPATKPSRNGEVGKAAPDSGSAGAKSGTEGSGRNEAQQLQREEPRT